MKKYVKVLIFVCTVLSVVSGCSGGVSQEEYEQVVSERDALKLQLSEIQGNNTTGLEESTEQSATAYSEPLPNSRPDVPLFEYSGTGDDVISDIRVNDYSYLVVHHTASGHFAVNAHYDESSDLLINTTQPYLDGQTLLVPDRDYTLEINAEGDWEMAAYPIGTISSDTFSGTGDVVTPAFISTSDIYHIEANGGGNFVVRGYNQNGEYELLVNTTDNYTGNVMLKQKGEWTFFEITGEREFRITPK